MNTIDQILSDKPHSCAQALIKWQAKVFDMLLLCFRKNSRVANDDGNKNDQQTDYVLMDAHAKNSPSISITSYNDDDDVLFENQPDDNIIIQNTVPSLSIDSSHITHQSVSIRILNKATSKFAEKIAIYDKSWILWILILNIAYWTTFFVFDTMYIKHSVQQWQYYSTLCVAVSFRILLLYLSTYIIFCIKNRNTANDTSNKNIDQLSDNQFRLQSQSMQYPWTVVVDSNSKLSTYYTTFDSIVLLSNPLMFLLIFMMQVGVVPTNWYMDGFWYVDTYYYIGLFMCVYICMMSLAVVYFTLYVSLLQIRKLYYQLSRFVNENDDSWRKESCFSLMTSTEINNKIMHTSKRVKDDMLSETFYTNFFDLYSKYHGIYCKNIKTISFALVFSLFVVLCVEMSYLTFMFQDIAENNVTLMKMVTYVSCITMMAIIIIPSIYILCEITKTYKKIIKKWNYFLLTNYSTKGYLLKLLMDVKKFESFIPIFGWKYEVSYSKFRKTLLVIILARFLAFAVKDSLDVELHLE